MKDIKEVLDGLKIPEMEIKTHQKLLKKQLLSKFETNKNRSFSGGGELSIMYLKSKGMFSKFAIGALVLLLAVAVATGFNPLNLQKANAQDIVKKALQKVSTLPQDQQAKLENEKQLLEKAQNSRDLHIDSSSRKRGSKSTVLRFTDESGHEETVEVDEDDLPIVANPSTTPSPSPSSTTITPSVSPGVQSAVRGGGSNDREDVKEVNVQSNTEIKSDSSISGSTEKSISGSKETEDEKKD